MLLLNYILSPILSWFCWCSCNMVSLCSPDNLELWIVLPFLPGGQVTVCSAALGYFLWHAKHINREVFQTWMCILIKIILKKTYVSHHIALRHISRCPKVQVCPFKIIPFLYSQKIIIKFLSFTILILRQHECIWTVCFVFLLRTLHCSCFLS